MLLRHAALLLAAPLLALAVACGDDDDDDPTATPTTPASTATTATSTVPASPTTPATAAPTTDGTVAPQNPGSTDPVTTKPMPDPLTTVPRLQDVRMGVHPENGGWERIVFEFEGGLPPARIEYVDSVAECGSGNAVELEGEAILEVTFQGAAAHTDAGQRTFAEQELEGPGETITETKEHCDFEALLAWAVGVTGEQNFKVTTLDSPPRLVIDVKQ